MAEDKSDYSNEVEKVIDNIGVSSWQIGLANALNETYSYANSSLFYALIPSYYRDWAWRYCRVACQWLDGYVPALHQGGFSGVISTRIASKLITGLTKQIVGEKLVFRLTSQKDEKALEALKFISKWANKANIIKAVYAGVGYSLGIGTCLIKANKTIDEKIWWESVRFDSCFYLASFQNEIKEATFVIRAYTDTREGKSNQQFFLVEHRFWYYYKPEIKKNSDGSFEPIHKKGDRCAMVEYKVHRVNGTSMNNIMPSSINESSVKWDELPKNIKEFIKNDYGTLRIDEPKKLGLPNLGVECLLNGEIDLSIPTGTNFGESMIVGIQDDLITYELASSYLIRDMYLGKGTVYLPKNLSVSDIVGDSGLSIGGDSPMNGFGENKIELMKGVSPEEQQAIVQQFQIRATEWQTIKDNALRNIAVKWGMSPKILSSYLYGGGGQKTATEIDSEDDMSIAFITHTRSYFKNALNRLLETTLNFYGYDANVEIDFASPSLINKDRLIDRVSKQLGEGLIDIDEAIRIINPDLEETVIQEKIEMAKQRQQELQMAQINEMNNEGGFGEDNNYDDLGGQNLNGSTNPAQ